MSQHSPFLSLPIRDEATARDLGAIVKDAAFAMASFQAMPKVYPLYIASRVKKALKASDSEEIIRDIGDIETIGDCRHAITATDFNGTKYRITVEVFGDRHE